MKQITYHRYAEQANHAHKQMELYRKLVEGVFKDHPECVLSMHGELHINCSHYTPEELQELLNKLDKETEWKLSRK